MVTHTASELAADIVRGCMESSSLKSVFFEVLQWASAQYVYKLTHSIICVIGRLEQDIISK
jgi:hypothetical protein